MKSLINISGLFLLAFLCLNPVWAAQEEVAGYEYRPFVFTQIKDFLGQIKLEKTELEKKLREVDKVEQKKIDSNPSIISYSQILSQGETIVKKLEQQNAGAGEELLFLRLQRLHYSVLADQGKGKHGSKLKMGLAIGVNIIGGHLGLKVSEIKDPNQKIGLKQALRESARLYSPEGAGPLKPTDLAEMTGFEVSRLKPRPNHPGIFDSQPGNHFQDFLKKITKMVKLQDPKLKSFDFAYARRILFFHELKGEATSPKITCKDRYGQKWKLKWGDEVHTDVALTRIYIDIGGTYSDQKFFSGPGETILILNPPAENKPDSVHTFSELADQLLKSKFKFHAHRYLLPSPIINGPDGAVLGTGQVDKEMAEKESIDPKYIGAYFVKFKECQLSFYNPAIKRLGATSLSNIGAPEDRASRSSLVLNCWFKNKDMKDDNSRIGLLFNPQSHEFDKPVEFQSDLGCAMGGLRPSGELNSFEKSFVLHRFGSISFVGRPLYIPRAWKECTWADARWMALRIAHLSRQDIERSLAESGWPPFSQKVAVERLISRRNELVRAFKLAEDGVKEMQCNPDFVFEVTHDGKKDFPVKKGEINGNSSLVQELESNFHPEGLAKVVNRKND